jgi:hypothetical protein
MKFRLLATKGEVVTGGLVKTICVLIIIIIIFNFLIFND